MQTKEKNRSHGHAFESREGLLLRPSNEAGNLNYIEIEFAVAKGGRRLSNANKTTASSQLIGSVDARTAARLCHLWKRPEVTRGDVHSPWECNICTGCNAQLSVVKIRPSFRWRATVAAYCCRCALGADVTVTRYIRQKRARAFIVQPITRR